MLQILASLPKAKNPKTLKSTDLNVMDKSSKEEEYKTV